MKTRTTINFDEELLQAARDSGVRNISGYLEQLVKQDLRSLQSMGKREARRIERLNEQLERVEDEWKDYVRRREGSLAE